MTTDKETNTEIDENMCAICQEDLNNGTQLVKLQCNHRFHWKCYEKIDCKYPCCEDNPEHQIYKECPLDRKKQIIIRKCRNCDEFYEGGYFPKCKDCKNKKLERKVRYLKARAKDYKAFKTVFASINHRDQDDESKMSILHDLYQTLWGDDD